ncbi:hypothetical protein HU200_026272 [Digitaria exilis]|uniref:Uncharacterized protein n=1 Tax=Digitaria exilis TaxID=1010633 RepID=A0A835C9C2_9POAL|nr:hypothetical protein HU200_026272 [Digitaria exilis]
MNTTVANLANNCVHTDGDTAAAIPRYELAAAVGHRGEEPAVDWTLPCRGRSATLPVLLLQGGQEAAKLTHPGWHPARRVVSILPQIHRFLVRKQGRRAGFRPASPIHPPQVCPLAPISGARRLEPAGFYCGRNFGSELGSAVDKSPSDTTLGPGRVVDHHDRLVVKEETKAVVGEVAAKRMQEEHHHQQQQQLQPPPTCLEVPQMLLHPHGMGCHIWRGCHRRGQGWVWQKLRLRQVFAFSALLTLW